MLVLASCSETDGSLVGISPDSTEKNDKVVSHEMMVLGRKLENPYSLDNVAGAMAALYPTKSAPAATDLYVRFLPETEEDFTTLTNLDLNLLDHPMDYEILRDGDYYHDPSLGDDRISWQYTVVPADFRFPDGIRYEILEECVIPDESLQTRGYEDVDWEAVEAKSFELTGNKDMLVPSTRSKSIPEGRITIVDNGSGKTVGVAGVKVVANNFVKVTTAYTDKDGNYTMDKKFSAKPTYRLCFKNVKGFTIGLNLVLVPASLSALGEGSPEGMDARIDKNSDGALFRRCAVNNSAYDYYSSCNSLGITPPPANMRFWIINFLRPSASVMMHHGALLDLDLVENYLGTFKILVRMFAPDIVIGSKGISESYSSLFSTVSHEMAHGSHFSNVGTDYWSKYAMYIITSYLGTGMCYGTGSGENAGHCEVGEMWAYYIQNKLYGERYGSDSGSGSGYWFSPQILSALEAEGVTASDICSALTASVVDRDGLRDRLANLRSDKAAAIKKVFAKYAK